MSDTPIGLDLDAQREDRAAAREGSNEAWPIIIGGNVVATLPVELPIDVFAPLRSIDSDIALLLRTAMDQARREQSDSAAASRWDATGLVIDLLASNPDLPTTVVDVVTKVASNLLGEEGLAAFMATRPSGQDVAALVQGVFVYYGVSLGESSPSSDSQETGGETSNQTSNSDTNSTSEASTDDPESLAS